MAHWLYYFYHQVFIKFSDFFFPVLRSHILQENIDPRTTIFERADCDNGSNCGSGVNVNSALIWGISCGVFFFFLGLLGCVIYLVRDHIRDRQLRNIIERIKLKQTRENEPSPDPDPEAQALKQSSIEGESSIEVGSSSCRPPSPLRPIELP